MTTQQGNTTARAATIYDVAKLAGVSHQTVSRLLKGERISPAYRERVEAALTELKYRPNLAARSLATRQSRRIAALVYEMGELGPMKILESASAAARGAGYVLDIVHMDPYDDESLSEAIDVAAKLDVAGILAFAPNDRMRAQLNQTPFRVPLYVETEDDAAETDTNRPNFNAIGAKLAVKHLVELGHTAIAHISGPLDWPSSRLRARSYREVLQAEGLRPVPVFEGNWSAASGYEQTLKILNSEPRFTAIFAANDQMALGALHALAQAKIPVPDAISVIGMDDTSEARYYTPSLSTIPMHFDIQGQYALESILDRISGRELPEKTEYVHTELVQRDSTGPAPQAL